MQTINTDIDSKIVQFKAKRTENTEQRQTDEAKQQYQLIAIVLGGIVLLSIAVLWYRRRRQRS